MPLVPLDRVRPVSDVRFSVPWPALRVTLSGPVASRSAMVWSGTAVAVLSAGAKEAVPVIVGTSLAVIVTATEPSETLWPPIKPDPRSS